MNNFRPKFIEIPYNSENINKYKSSDNMLKHARFIQGVSFGKMLVNSRLDELVGYIGIEGDTIISLEVSEKYRNQGIATSLISDAIDMGVTKLTVNKNNKTAIDLYKNLGFRIYRSTDRMYFMKLRS